jgi:integrase
MLSVYCRHRQHCARRSDIYWRRCHCPKWIQGTLPNGKYLRQTANTKSWEQAETQARHLEVGCDPEQASVAPPPPVQAAVELFLADQTARSLGIETRRKYRTVLERQFLQWARRERVQELKQITPSHLTRFRSSWGNGASTTFRKHEMLSSFFTFCVQQQYLKHNPMQALKKPKAPDSAPTDYFRPQEFEQIVAATDRYTYGGIDCQWRGRRLRALTLLMRWSGLSILDATKLERRRLTKNADGDDQIFLYRAKTGVPVCVVIPPAVADALRALPNPNPRYFFWSGLGDPRSGRKGFQRSYWKLFKLARIEGEDGQTKRCHPHMFRDTFAVELLLAGNPIDQVSLLLGHSSVKITERHYAPFCRARQLQLTAAVKKAWTGHVVSAAAVAPATSGSSSAPASHTGLSAR